MTKNYMISFSYDNANYYANVHEVKNSPAVYHIRIVSPFHTEVPRQINFAEENGKIVTDSVIPDSLFDALCRALNINC